LSTGLRTALPLCGGATTEVVISTVVGAAATSVDVEVVVVDVVVLGVRGSSVFEHPTSKPDAVRAMSRYFFILSTVSDARREARNELNS
jgi:hypothetical protein